MKFRGLAGAALPLVLSIGCWVTPAAADRDRDNDQSAATIAARERFFGAENVDPDSGTVAKDRVIFSWVTNSSLAVSLRGRIVLLDTYIIRLELPPPAGQPDLRRSPIDVQDLIDLKPEAILVGHGHGDHADNAAYIAKWARIPIYAAPETCDAMQADVTRMFNDPNTVNGGVKLIPDGNPVTCIPVVSRGSVPGAEIVHLKLLEPIACIVAFKHIHSGTVPTDPNFPFIPVNVEPDPRDADLYPPGTPVTPRAGVPPVPGQMNLTTTAGAGGPISLFYQFILRDPNHFSFVWNDTVGPLKEGVGSDPGLPSPAVGAHLFAIMESLPETDIEFGSGSGGTATNGMRDPILYQQHIKPQIYVPLHMSQTSLGYKIAYQKAVVAADVPVRPELRWLVDPNDYLRPMVYDPDDERWTNYDKERRLRQFCR